jgi:hypothetical protein
MFLDTVKISLAMGFDGRFHTGYLLKLRWLFFLSNLQIPVYQADKQFYRLFISSSSSSSFFLFHLSSCFVASTFQENAAIAAAIDHRMACAQSSLAFH